MYGHSLGIIYTDLLSVPEVNQGLSNFLTANWNPLSQPFAWLSLCYGVSWVYVQQHKIVKTKEQWAEQEKKHFYTSSVENQDVLHIQTGLKLGKEYVKAVYCHPAYLTYMQSI